MIEASNGKCGRTGYVLNYGCVDGAFDECKVFEDYFEIASSWREDEDVHFELFEVIVDAIGIKRKRRTSLWNAKNLF